MPGSLEMCLIRHGQSTANAEGIWQGQLEFPLSELGHEQARLAGLALAETGSFDGVYTSPLSRARQTAEIISRRLAAADRFDGEVVEIPGLTERHGGLLQGRPWAQTQQESPDLIDKFRILPAEEGWSLVGAETDGKIMSRFGKAVAKIQARHTGGSRVIVVAHGGVLRAFLRSTFGDEVLPGGARTPNASITRLIWESSSERPELSELASTSHLDDLPG